MPNKNILLLAVIVLLSARYFGPSTTPELVTPITQPMIETGIVQDEILVDWQTLTGEAQRQAYIKDYPLSVRQMTTGNKTTLHRMQRNDFDVDIPYIDFKRVDDLEFYYASLGTGNTRAEVIYTDTLDIDQFISYLRKNGYISNNCNMTGDISENGEIKEYSEKTTEIYDNKMVEVQRQIDAGEPSDEIEWGACGYGARILLITDNPKSYAWFAGMRDPGWSPYEVLKCPCSIEIFN